MGISEIDTTGFPIVKKGGRVWGFLLRAGGAIPSGILGSDGRVVVRGRCLASSTAPLTLAAKTAATITEAFMMPGKVSGGVMVVVQDFDRQNTREH